MNDDGLPSCSDFYANSQIAKDETSQIEAPTEVLTEEPHVEDLEVASAVESNPSLDVTSENVDWRACFSQRRPGITLPCSAASLTVDPQSVRSEGDLFSGKQTSPPFARTVVINRLRINAYLHKCNIFELYFWFMEHGFKACLCCIFSIYW